MGGGDLNLKKSWHPSTLKNQERVWKAEQQDAMEKKKTEQLQQELKLQREKEHYQSLADGAQGSSAEKKGKMDWMYKGVSALVDREDYLLGRKVDKTFDVIKAAEEQKDNPVDNSAGDGLPSQLFRQKGDADFVAVDMAAKVREDPLYLIKRQEYDSKKQLLSNPIKMKMLQDMIAMEKSKKSKKHKKKSKKKKKKKGSDDSDMDEEDIDAKIAAYREKLMRLSPDAPSRRDSDDERRQSQQSSREDRDLLLRSKKFQDRSRNSDSSSPPRKRDRSRSPQKSKRRFRSSERGHDSKPRQKGSENRQNRRQTSSSPEARTRRSPPRRRQSPERSRKSPERSRKSPERLRKSPERTKRSPEKYGRSSEKSRRSPESKANRNYYERLSQDAKERKRSARSPERRRDSSSPVRRQSSRSPRRTRDQQSPPRKHSQSPEERRQVETEKSSHKYREDGFGLVKRAKDSSRDDGYVKKDYRLINEERKRKEDEERRLLQKKLSERSSRKMTQEEKERKLREMQQDAAVHEKQRLEYVKRHTKADAIEVEGYREGGFKGAEMLANAVDSCTVERRLKSNLKGVHRTSRAMETNFLRK